MFITFFIKQKTSDDVPDRSGKSSRNSRSFRQALRGSRGNRRTAKVAPLHAKNSEQKGALVSPKHNNIVYVWSWLFSTTSSLDFVRCTIDGYPLLFFVLNRKHQMLQHLQGNYPRNLGHYYRDFPTAEQIKVLANQPQLL